jgi:hypothetical protein
MCGGRCQRTRTTLTFLPFVRPSGPPRTDTGSHEGCPHRGHSSVGAWPHILRNLPTAHMPTVCFVTQQRRLRAESFEAHSTASQWMKLTASRGERALRFQYASSNGVMTASSMTDRRRQDCLIPLEKKAHCSVGNHGLGASTNAVVEYFRRSKWARPSTMTFNRSHQSKERQGRLSSAHDGWTS